VPGDAVPGPRGTATTPTGDCDCAPAGTVAAADAAAVGAVSLMRRACLWAERVAEPALEPECGAGEGGVRLNIVRVAMRLVDALTNCTRQAAHTHRDTHSQHTRGVSQARGSEATAARGACQPAMGHTFPIPLACSFCCVANRGCACQHGRLTEGQRRARKKARNARGRWPRTRPISIGWTSRWHFHNLHVCFSLLSKPQSDIRLGARESHDFVCMRELVSESMSMC
jgi:hypothetical protein